MGVSELARTIYDTLTAESAGGGVGVAGVGLGGQSVPCGPSATLGFARSGCGRALIMQKINFEEELDKVVQRDPRYHRDAYLFVREALDHTQKILKKPKEGIHHVSGQQLLQGIRDYVLLSFGPMATTVLEEWGVKQCEDFGELVFNMVETGLLAKTENDSRADFKGGYDFDTAFRQPFLPATKRLTRPEPSKLN